MPGLGLGLSYAAHFDIKSDGDGKGWGGKTSIAVGRTGLDTKTVTAFCAGIAVALVASNIATLTRTLV